MLLGGGDWRCTESKEEPEGKCCWKVETGGVLSLRRARRQVLLEGGGLLSLRKSQKASAAGRWRYTVSEGEREGKCCWKVETGGVLSLKKSQKASSAGRWRLEVY